MFQRFPRRSVGQADSVLRVCNSWSKIWNFLIKLLYLCRRQTVYRVPYTRIEACGESSCGRPSGKLDLRSSGPMKQEEGIDSFV